MRRPSAVLPLVVLAPLLAAATCQGAGGGSGINFQPAKTPQLVHVGGWRWSADTDGVGYTGGFGFEVTVKHTLFNDLTVRVVENQVPTEVPRADAWPPSGPPRTVYRKMQTLDTDVNAVTETLLLHIYPPESFSSPLTPPPDGTRRTYQFLETSGDPNLTGTAKVSAPVETTLEVWRQACVVPLFDVTPTNLTAGKPVTVQWRADECKNVKLLELVSDPAGGAPHVVAEKTFVNAPAGSLSGTSSFTVSQQTTAFGIRASNASGRTWMATVSLNVNAAGPCPENQPYGSKKWFDFCEKCLGQPPNQVSVPACTQQQARDAENQALLGQNCKADDGACFVDGKGDPSSSDSSGGSNGGLSPDGCCCRPGANAPICNPGEAEWACKNSAGATWTAGACK